MKQAEGNLWSQGGRPVHSGVWLRVSLVGLAALLALMAVGGPVVSEWVAEVRSGGGDRAFEQGVLEKSVDTPWLRGRLLERSQGWPIPGAEVHWVVKEQVASRAISDGEGYFHFDRRVLGEKTNGCQADGELAVFGKHVDGTVKFSQASVLRSDRCPLPVPGLVHWKGRVEVGEPRDPWRGKVEVRPVDTSIPLEEADLADDGSFLVSVAMGLGNGAAHITVEHPRYPPKSMEFIPQALVCDLGVIIANGEE